MWKRWWDRLTQPMPSLLHGNRYDEIQITSRLMILVGLCVSVATILYALATAVRGQPLLPIIPLIGSALLLLWSSQAVRSGDVVRPLTFVAFASTLMIVMLAIVVGGEDALRVTYLFTGIMLFGVIYLPLRTLIWLAIAHLVVTVAMPLYVPGMTWDRVLGLFSPLWLLGPYWSLSLPLAWFHRRGIRLREHQIEQEHQRYQQLIADLPDPLVVLGLDGTILDINEAGRAASEMQPGDNIIPAINASLTPEYARAVMAMLTTESPPTSGRARPEITMRDFRSGQDHTYELNHRLNSVDGKPSSVTVLARNVTERRRMEQALRISEARYRILTDMMFDYAMCFVYQPDGTLIREWVTDSFYQVLGIPLDTQEERGYGESVHPDDRMRWTEDWFAVLAGETRDGEYRVNHADGREQWIFIRRKVVTDADGVRRIYSVGRDVTERVQSERQRLARAIEQERYSTIARFITAVSHDFRTRLSSLEANRYLIQRVIEQLGIDKTQPVLLDKLTAIDQIVHYMGEQLDHMSLISLAREVKRQSFSIADLLDTVVTDFQPIATNSSITLTRAIAADLPTVTGDPDDIRRALGQLLRNALHHTPPGGAVTLQAAAGGGGVQISVSDTGAGISADDLPYVFDPFYLGDAARNVDSGGVGVGLTMVKIIMAMNGGDISVDSAPGSGTTITLTLPSDQPLTPDV